MITKEDVENERNRKSSRMDEKLRMFLVRSKLFPYFSKERMRIQTTHDIPSNEAGAIVLDDMRKKFEIGYTFDTEKNLTKGNKSLNKQVNVSRERKETREKKKVVKKVEESDSKFTELVERNKFTNDPSTPIKDVDWIYHNIGIKGVKPEDAPSSGAYFQLQEIQRDPDTKKEFYRMYMNRRLPSRNSIEELEEDMNDDGTNLVGFIQNTIIKTLKGMKVPSDT